MHKTFHVVSKQKYLWIRIGSSHQGFTIIEMLVSLVLLSLVSLGFITTYLQTKQALQQGFYRIRAIAIADDLIERINLVSKDAGALALYLERDLLDSDVEPGFGCHNRIYPCTPKQIAAADIEAITYYLGHSLPNGNLKVDGCNGSLCITLSWLETDLDSCKTESNNCVFTKFNTLP